MFAHLRGDLRAFARVELRGADERQRSEVGLGEPARLVTDGVEPLS